mmetsp:Transcript_9941/g.42275  ORF Transcript_9941/g.42275 Transcript_9941/m.42275 type:complete len:250 (-) Transcript_9941:2285-3034(-)
MPESRRRWREATGGSTTTPAGPPPSRNPTRSRRRRRRGRRRNRHRAIHQSRQQAVPRRARRPGVRHVSTLRSPRSPFRAFSFRPASPSSRFSTQPSRPSPAPSRFSRAKPRGGAACAFSFARLATKARFFVRRLRAKKRFSRPTRRRRVESRRPPAAGTSRAACLRAPPPATCRAPRRSTRSANTRRRAWTSASWRRTPLSPRALTRRRRLPTRTNTATPSLLSPRSTLCRIPGVPPEWPTGTGGAGWR